MAKTKKQPSTNADLRRLMLKWQKRFRLMDWDITIQFDREDGICDLRGAWAMCFCTGPIRAVDIIIKHHKFSENKDYDIEVVLVHELLHIFWSGIHHKDSAGNQLEEQMVDTLSILLVDLERHGSKAGRPIPFDSPLYKGRHVCARHSVKKERYEEEPTCGY